MRLRPPSLGFCYLLLTLAVVPVFFAYVNGPFFFEHPWGSRARQLGEASYLLDISAKCTDDRRQGWLRTGFELALQTGELQLVDRAIALFEAGGVGADTIGLREIVPGTVQAYGLDAEGWTSGNQLATFILRNSDDQPRQVALRFTTFGDGKARYVAGGDPVWFTFDGKGPEKAGSVTSPVVPPKSRVAISVGAANGFARDGRQLGLKFERVELLR